MSHMWGIHNDTLGAELVEGGFIAIGWEKIPDLRSIGADRKRLREEVQRAYPGAKPGAWPVWAGVLHRFAFEMEEGDLVIAPHRADSTLNFGRVVGPYERLEVERQPHRRRVEWIKTGVSRGLFPQSALHEIGAAVTLFRVKTHEHIFRDFLQAESDEAFEQRAARLDDAQTVDADTSSAATAAVEYIVNADRVEQHTQDFVTRALLDDLSHEQFEQFTADLLVAMGYEARVTRFSADGGVDVIAHRDALGLEPPLIKVQCKHTGATQGRPEVQRLIGTLSSGEVGLFVCLGGFSNEAIGLERERQNLRLLGGPDVVALVLANYDRLPARWREMVPLKPLLVVNRAPESQ